MKKIVAILAVALIGMSAAFSAKAIEDPNPKGTKVVGLQAGFLPGIGGSVYGEYVLVDSWWKGHFSVGAHIGFRHYGTGLGYNYNEFALAPRASYGLNITEQFEAHVAVVSGLGFSGYTYNYSDGTKSHSSSVGLCYGTLVGARYFLSEGFGLSAEVGYLGYAPYTNVGICFKF